MWAEDRREPMHWSRKRLEGAGVVALEIQMGQSQAPADCLGTMRAELSERH